MSAQPISTHYPDLPRSFDTQARGLIYAMVDAGFTGRVTTKGHWLGKAPNGETFTVPSKMSRANRSAQNTEAQFKRWLRNNAPDEVKVIIDAMEGLHVDDPIVDTLVNAATRKQVEGLMARKEIVSVKPWLARKHSGKDGGTRYESQTTLERTHGNGDIDYACSFIDCDYTSTNPRSVAQHFGQQHTRKGESEPAGTGPHHIDPEYTEPVSSREYRPTERLLNTLADFLSEHSWDNVDDLALLFLTWANDRPYLDHEARPLVPLTDKQMLDKIRMIVGQPDQTETIERLTRERDEANAHLVKVQRDLAGIKELMEGVGR